MYIYQIRLYRLNKLYLFDINLLISYCFLFYYLIFLCLRYNGYWFYIFMGEDVGNICY